MAPNIIKVLTQAIKEKHCVAIRYHGQGHIRVLEPHAIYTAENGEIVVDAFQIRGYSSSGRPTPFWRPFRLKKINAVSMLKEVFTARVVEGFNPAKSKYKSGLYALVDDHPSREVRVYSRSHVRRNGRRSALHAPAPWPGPA